MPKCGHSIALRRLENQVSPIALHNVEFNILCRLGGKTLFSCLSRAMECPDLDIINVDCSKNLFSLSHTHFVSETIQNYQFWINIVTEMAMSGQ